LLELIRKLYEFTEFTENVNLGVNRDVPWLFKCAALTCRNL